MAEYLAIPKDKIHVVYPGLNLTGHGGPRTGRNESPFTLGYFARICPEKGLHVLAEAFVQLHRMPETPASRLRISGWLGSQNQAYLEDIRKRLEAAGLGDRVEHVSCPDHASKVRFLQGLHLLCVPTTYREPKGLYVLEAWANGVPVVQPRHGSFPELIEMTQGGWLVPPDNPAELAAAIRRLMEQPDELRQAGRRGHDALKRHFTAERMARETVEVFEKYTRE